MLNTSATFGIQKIERFTDLYTWQKAHALVLSIYEITKKFPGEEKFGLIQQMRRAAVSVTSNIAEGFRRRTAADKRQFYATAMGSLTEIENQLMIARDVSFCSLPEYQKAIEQCDVVGKMIRGMMRSAAPPS